MEISILGTNYKVSGLHVNTHDITQWATDEEMVDWIAIQMPKIMAVYESIIVSKKVEITTLDGNRKCMII